ncbi:hypothetical protein [Janibacter melonis]|uniref:hypothetical protein n=1 Tax=Janibacter melonis TaxID=262209 RepID=UPI00177C47AA|nr:hypothetical protein [Janibacter melonis]
MSVTEGLDPALVREVAAHLADQAGRADDVSTSGTAMLRVLDGCWAGGDVEDFARGWQQAAPSISAAARALRSAADDLERQVADQEGASGGRAPSVPVARESPDRPWWQDTWEGAGDLADDLLGAGEEALDTVADGAEWLGDRAEDGLDWLGDRGDEAGRWLGDRASDLVAGLSRYGESVAHTFVRLAEAADHHLDLFTDVFTQGRWPRLSEVVASTLLLGGSVANLAGALLTGRDLDLLDDGTGTVTGSTELSTSGSVDGHPALRRPISLAEIMLGTTDAYAVEGSIRVTQVTQPDGSTAYVVATPGTQSWGPTTGSNTFDLTGNLVAMSGQQSAAMQAVQEAMAQAQIPPDAPVMLVGHSQGGIVTTALLEDPAFTSRYDITHSLTYGAPADTFDTDPSVLRLDLQHASDAVPRLDLGDSLYDPLVPLVPLPNLDQLAHGNGPGATTVTLPDPAGPLDLAGNHSHAAYADSVAASQDPAVAAYEASLAAFLAEDGAVVTGTDYEVGRED